MTPKEHSWTIVVVGHWNRMIFTPHWVGRKIFEVEHIQTLISPNLSAPVIYRNDDVALSIRSGRVVVEVTRFADDSVQTAETMMCKVLSELSQTPVSAIGINFGFIIDEQNARLLDLFRFSDEADIPWNTEMKKITREFVKDDVILNLSFSLADQNLEIDANFHKNVKDATEALHAIRGNILARKTQLLQLLEGTYDLKPAEAQSNV
jgi:hypothetical protein